LTVGISSFLFYLWQLKSHLVVYRSTHPTGLCTGSTSRLNQVFLNPD
jgi:hypothetical protein